MNGTEWIGDVAANNFGAFVILVVGVVAGIFVWKALPKLLDNVAVGSAGLRKELVESMGKLAETVAETSVLLKAVDKKVDHMEKRNEEADKLLWKGIIVEDRAPFADRARCFILYVADGNNGTIRELFLAEIKKNPEKWEFACQIIGTANPALKPAIAEINRSL